MDQALSSREDAKLALVRWSAILDWAQTWEVFKLTLANRRRSRIDLPAPVLGRRETHPGGRGGNPLAPAESPGRFK